MAVEDAVVPEDIPLSFLPKFPLWVPFSIVFVTCLAFFRFNRNDETNRDVELVPRSPVDYPYCICQGRLIQCPSPKNCQHLFCTQCLRDFNERKEILVCPSCSFSLSPRGGTSTTSATSETPPLDYYSSTAIHFSYVEEEFILREDLNFVTPLINIHIGIGSPEDIVPFVSEKSDLDEDEREVVSYFITRNVTCCLTKRNGKRQNCLMDEMLEANF